MPSPLVSVIVPVYNCARFLREALESVYRQGIADLEVIAVDDGSTDGSLRVIEEIGAPVRVLRQHNIGPAAARNRAVRESRGRYLAFIDGDDVWLSGKLRAQLDYMERADAQPIVFTQFAYWRPDSAGNYQPAEVRAREAASRLIPGQWSGWLYPQILLGSPIHIITTLIRREVFDAVGGFDEALRGGSDYDFWIKAARRYQAHRIPGCHALYRLHGSGVTSVPRPVNYPYLVLTRALENLGPCGPDGRCLDHAAVQARLAHLSFRFGRMHYLGGDVRVAREAFMRALRHDNRHFKALAYAGLAMIRGAFGKRVTDALHRSARSISHRSRSDA